MKDAGGLFAVAATFGFTLGLAVAWLLERRRLRQRSARLEHRIAESERRFAALHDGFLQDVQGLALSLQAVADQLPPDMPARRGLERVLDRTDELLTEGGRLVRRARDGGDGAL